LEFEITNLLGTVGSEELTTSNRWHEMEVRSVEMEKFEGGARTRLYGVFRLEFLERPLKSGEVSGSTQFARSFSKIMFYLGYMSAKPQM
jgi:hypothetical protein